MRIDVDTIDIERINRMDTSAFKLLYGLFYKALVGCAFNITQDADASEDIVQEIFTSLWERKRSFLTPAALRAFFYSSVHNAALNWLKHRTVVDEYTRQTLDHARLTAAASEDEIFNEEVYHQLFTAIGRLPERQRDVFMLHMEGKSNMEIAAALNMAVETVKTHKKRGMAYLRQNVNPQCLLVLFMSGCHFPPYMNYKFFRLSAKIS